MTDMARTTGGGTRKNTRQAASWQDLALGFNKGAVRPEPFQSIVSSPMQLLNEHTDFAGYSSLLLTCCWLCKLSSGSSYVVGHEE